MKPKNLNNDLLYILLEDPVILLEGYLEDSISAHLDMVFFEIMYEITTINLHYTARNRTMDEVENKGKV